jgi:hypothetical protein
MRASQILTEKSIDEKLENSVFKYKFILHGQLQAFLVWGIIMYTSDILKDMRIQSSKLQSNLNLRALVVSFKKSLISRTSLKSNLKHIISTSILRKE